VKITREELKRIIQEETPTRVSRSPRGRRLARKLAAVEVHEMYLNGLRFEESIRKVSQDSGVQPGALARTYCSEFGSLPDNHTLKDFKD